MVAAFHHLSAILLLDPELDSIDLDVLVLGDDRPATDLVQALAARIPGVRGVYAGRLRNCGQIEALTANLVSINRRYKAHAGLRITDPLSHDDARVVHLIPAKERNRDLIMEEFLFWDGQAFYQKIGLA